MDALNKNSNRCRDCTKPISLLATRCKSCSNSGANNPNYKGGYKGQCIDCGKEISRKDHSRCLSCAKKGDLSHFASVKFYGERNPNWKGGISDLRVLIRGLIEYKAWRTVILARDEFSCQKCNAKRNLRVHHKRSFAKILHEFLKEYNQFSPFEDKIILVRIAINYKPFWNINNGQTLCERCHKVLETIDGAKNIGSV